MKKIFTLALLALGAMAANAQYVSTTKGAVYEYAQTVTADGKTLDMPQTKTVTDVVTGADGIVTVTIETETTVPESVMGTVKEDEITTYNPADKTTTFIIEEAESTKATLINTLVEQARAAGQTPSDSDIKELEGMITAKGEISIALTPDMAAGTKLPNKTLKLTVGPQTMKYNLWEGVVLGTESITVPAGTFDCIKFQYMIKQTMGENVGKQYVTAWYAPGVGEVRSELAEKKNGTPMGVCELTSIKLPE